MTNQDALRAAALAAREAGDFGDAVRVWRALLDLVPEDWATALELKQDLKAGLHYPDSDGRFRRAARFLPDEAWLAHYSLLYAFHGSDLEAIDARARVLVGRWPGEARLHAIIGDVARQRRDWDEAARRFATAARLQPEQPYHGPKAAAARCYARLSGSGWQEAAAGGARLGVSVVNLDRNGERMEELGRQFRGLTMHRAAAVEGGRLPGAAVRLLAGDLGAPRGTLGCFLSHAAAWEALVARGDSHGLVIEDDVVPLLELPETVGALGIPDGFDLCFVNDRMEPKLDMERASGVTAQGLAATMRAFHPEDNAPGADGYVLSRVGAAKLLAWVAEDGFADHVDWRMLAYSLSPAEIGTMPGHSHARAQLTRLQGLIGRDERLRAYALHPALVRTVGVSSDREDEDRLRAG